MHCLAFTVFGRNLVHSLARNVLVWASLSSINWKGSLRTISWMNRKFIGNRMLGSFGCRWIGDTIHITTFGDCGPISSPKLKVNNLLIIFHFIIFPILAFDHVRISGLVVCWKSQSLLRFYSALIIFYYFYYGFYNL